MRVLLSVLALAGLCLPLAADWTRFRGPNGEGTVAASSVPLKWTPKEFRWKVAIPGIGYSSPVVFGERIFVTSSEKKSGNRRVFCLDVKDGRMLWQKEFAGKEYRMHRRNSVASSTPAVDADRVYLCWGTPTDSTVQALDHQGKEVWQTALPGYPSQHGFGVSPMLHDGMLVIHHQPDGDGALIALDCRTGKVRWKTPRSGSNATYSTPCVFQPTGRSPQLILTNWKHGITGIDPATGKVGWEATVFDQETKMRSIASPVVSADLVIGVCGFISGRKQMVAVRPGASGKPPEKVWAIEQAVPQMATPLVKGNRVFTCTEVGIASWIQADTGKVVWRQRIGGAFTASPIGVGDRIYCTSGDGKVVVLSASDTFAVLAENTLGEATQCTPAFSGDRLYFRTDAHLIALGGK